MKWLILAWVGIAGMAGVLVAACCYSSVRYSPVALAVLLVSFAATMLGLIRSDAYTRGR